MKLLFVTFEMGTDGTFFSDGAGATGHRDEGQVMKSNIYNCKLFMKNLDHYNTVDYNICIILYAES